MDTEATLELTKTACFKTDLPRIKRFSEALEVRHKAGFSNQHVVSRALDALERELSQPESQAA